jgi:mitogen-activated protein kinase kinase kinase 5
MGLPLHRLAIASPAAPIQFEFIMERSNKKILGKGAFGTVYAVINKDTKTEIAMKEVNIRPTEDTQQLRQEILLHQRWNDPHIVRYLGCDVTTAYFRIFMELVQGGSLATMLCTTGGLAENVVGEYARQILKGIVFLHRENVVHRDIKGGNILVDALRADPVLKLADFGTSKRLARLNPTEKAAAQGTLS